MKPFMFVVELAGAAPLAAQTASPQTVVAAEHAFAKEVAAKGIKRGFLAFAAPDAIMFTPGPANARATFATQPDGPPESPPLDWWPDFAGIASSGDLGFTSGPATSPVRYFTVWKKQPDGSWKWIFDGGTPLPQPMPGGAATEPVLLSLANSNAGSAAAAIAEIAPLEGRIAAGSADDHPGALTSFLAKQALVANSPTPSIAGGDHDKSLATPAKSMTLHGLGQSASAAGDMVFTYGEARWMDANEPRWGHYARIWQKHAEDGWRLVADVLIPARGAPPEPAG